VVVTVALLASLCYAAAAEAAARLPFKATGALGVLDTSGAAHRVTFDTSSGIYSVDGVARNRNSARRRIEILVPGAGGFARQVRLWAFDFNSIRLGPSTDVLVRGKNPLVLLSRGQAFLGAPLVLDGAAGTLGGRGAGGGGGGGGGAVAVFAHDVLTLADTISVNGGRGGAGNLRRRSAAAQTAPGTPFQGGGGGAGQVVLGSSERILYQGTVNALSGGLRTPGRLVLVGPVAFGRHAAFNGVAPSRLGAVESASALPQESLRLNGGSGGGGAGGGGLPELPAPGYARSLSPGGGGGPGGGAGGAGGYAIAGGKGGAGGNAGLGTNAGGGGGGGGGAYGGIGGNSSSGDGTGSGGGLGGTAVSGSCSTIASGGGPGNGGMAQALGAGNGGNGGTGGSTVGGNGTNGGQGQDPPYPPGGTHIGGGGGGGGGGADGCGTTAPGAGGAGGQGGVAGNPGAPGSAGGRGVPTLSDIGMAILIVLLVGTGVMLLRRRFARGSV
jgi:hypothetical protein